MRNPYSNPTVCSTCRLRVGYCPCSKPASLALRLSVAAESRDLKTVATLWVEAIRNRTPLPKALTAKLYNLLRREKTLGRLVQTAQRRASAVR